MAKGINELGKGYVRRVGKSERISGEERRSK